VKPSEARLINVALEWWMNRRPFTYSLDQHLKNPTVNTYGGPDEIKLMQCCADVRRERRKAKSEGRKE
jgi:hypothetical protein